jgi:hypothetical protein
MDHLYEADLALQNSSVQRRVEQTLTPASMNSKVRHVRNIMKALIDVRRPKRTPWSGRLPRPRKSPAVTLGDCVVKIMYGQRQVTKGTRRDPTILTTSTIA